MSWDVMVMDVGTPPPPMEEMEAGNVMGSPDKVREQISAHLPDVDWSDPSWGIYEGDGFSFEFNMGEEEEQDGFMVHVRGGGDAISALLQFAIPNGWSLLDCSTSEWIDPDNPSDEGWTGFQEFRDRVIKREDEEP